MVRPTIVETYYCTNSGHDNRCLSDCLLHHLPIPKLTTEVLSPSLTAGGGHDELFGAVEAVLRDRYPAHILPPSQMEWIFINAGRALLSTGTLSFLVG